VVRENDRQETRKCRNEKRKTQNEEAVQRKREPRNPLHARKITGAEKESE